MVEMRIINMPDNFDEFWSMYPRKKSKKIARKKFNKLKIQEQKDCIEGAKMYLKEIKIKGTDQTYIKHPTTFINGECWEDEFEVDEKQEALQASDYPMDQVGSSRMGWCEKCNKYDFYDKFTIHQQESKCHQARLMTCKSV